MKKLFLVLFLGLAFLSSGFAKDSYKPEYKLSVVVGPAGPWGESAAMFCELVKKYSDGRINIKPYYSGQLFSGKQTNEFLLMKQGVIDFAVSSTINWSTTVKELNLFSLPFFFTDYDALDRVIDGPAGKKLFSCIEEKGVIPLSWGENGFRELTNSKTKIEKPADMKGLKIRVVGSPIFIDVFKALGANPVSMNWAEAITAFNQGTVDGQENPAVSVIVPSKIWQYHKHLFVWHCAIDPLVFGVSGKTWQKFNEQDRTIIMKAAKEAAAWEKEKSRDGLTKDAPLFGTLAKNGMEITYLSAENRKLFKEAVSAVSAEWEKKIGRDLVMSAKKSIIK